MYGREANRMYYIIILFIASNITYNIKRFQTREQRTTYEQTIFTVGICVIYMCVCIYSNFEIVAKRKNVLVQKNNNISSIYIYIYI